VDRTDLHTDVERLGDGSGVWLWRVIHRGRLWSAGLATSQDKASADAARAVRMLGHHLRVREQRARDRAGSADIPEECRHEWIRYACAATGGFQSCRHCGHRKPVLEGNG
jgi:hypothetical protein